jgi:sugar/nucleoside kinase (ribokinase family)
MTVQRHIKAFDLVALGAINEDWIAGASRLTPDEREQLRESGPDIEWGQETVVSLETLDEVKATLPGVEWQPEIGGSALNVVDAISRLRPRLRLAVIGVEGARRSSAQTQPRVSLNNCGINVDLLRPHSNAEPMGQCLSIVDDRGERTLITAPCANREIVDLLGQEAVATRLASSRVVHVTSLLDDRSGFEDAPASKVAEVLCEVRRRSPDTIFSLDPGFGWSNAPTSSIVQILELADIVFFNLREFQTMSSRFSPDLSGPRVSAETRANAILKHCGDSAALLVLKLTGATQLFLRRDGHTQPSETFRGPLVKTSEIEDSTGAGDLFAAGVLATVASPKVSGYMGIALGMQFAARGLTQEGKVSYPNLSDQVDDLVKALTGGPERDSSQLVETESSSETATPTPKSLLAVVLVVLDAVVIVLSLVKDLPVWLSVAVIAASAAGGAAWIFARRWRMFVIAVSAVLAAVLFAFAAEGVRGALMDDAPSTHRYFLREQVFPKTAPDTNAGEALDAGLLDAGRAVNVVCLKDDSWAKLQDGSWVPGNAVQAEVGAEPAPNC